MKIKLSHDQKKNNKYSTNARIKGNQQDEDKQDYIFIPKKNLHNPFWENIHCKQKSFLPFHKLIRS